MRILLLLLFPSICFAQQVGDFAIPKGGYTPVAFLNQTTTVQTVKASAGKLGGYYIFNPNTSNEYCQIFDVSGAVTLGTTVPKLSFGIPIGSGANLSVQDGIDFANAIKIACTTTATGLTAPAIGLDTNWWYK